MPHDLVLLAEAYEKMGQMDGALAAVMLTAQQLLRKIYDRFTEGFDSADLKAAKAWLAELEMDR